MASPSITSYKGFVSSNFKPIQSLGNASSFSNGFFPFKNSHSAPWQRKSFVSCRSGATSPLILCSSHKIALPQGKLNRTVVNAAATTTRDELPPSGRRRQLNTRRNFSLRLKPRWRLLKMKMKHPSIRSFLNVAREFLKTNSKLVKFCASTILSLGLFFMFLRFTSPPTPSLVPYSEFIENLQDGRVSKVLVEEGSRRIYYAVKAESGGPDSAQEEVEGGIASRLKRFAAHNQAKPDWQFLTRKIDRDEKFLLKVMRETGTSYRSSPQSALASIRSTLITIIALWIPLTPLMWLLYRQFASSNSPAKKRKPKNLSVTFDDVEGVDSAKIELMEVVACLQGASNYQKLGAKMPKGVLLVGPPGTGKTLLARAVAGEAGVPFFSVSASEFVELFVGRGAARIRDLFSVARKCAPSIVFIDELDAVGGKRGRSFNDERDQTLNQLLTEMDGFESEKRVVVIAATNRPEALDPALCRPGRFSRKVLVGEPSEEGRRRILAVHLRGVPLEEDGELICGLVAALTGGLVGADLANIVNEASLLAGRRGREKVAREDFMEAIERARYGIVQRTMPTNSIGKDLVRLFPWMNSFGGRNQSKDGSPLGYQTLS